ncbi:MAG TPA: HDOD domain-containing protein [Planctomycetota bacterium]|nr:HDOD domain-containing protein [Planctomycetota bacterium]
MTTRTPSEAPPRTGDGSRAGTGSPRVLNRATFRQIVDRVHTVPSLPEVVTQVCRLINDPSSNAAQVHDIVKKDAAMAAKILRMVNSVYYGLGQPVNDLEQALVIVGFKTIRSIALSISVINMFQQQNACFSMKAFWTHSAVSAAICRLLAGRTKICDPELAFVIGLLKDIGKLVLVENAPDECRAVIAVAKEFQYPFHRAAREVLQTNDAEIGAWLCEKWQLDPAIIEAVRDQYDLTREERRPLVAMCQFVDYLCGLKNIKVSGDCGRPELDPQVWDHLGLDKTALVEVLSVVNDEVDNARQLLQLASS